MATLFYGAATTDGSMVLGLALTPKDIEALNLSETIVVKLSPTAQATLETKASNVVLMPCEEAEVGKMAQRIPGVGTLVVNEGKLH
jgi:hypothetical protein